MKNVAIILSGGISARFKNSSNTPKQYLQIAGKTIIEHSIEVFQKNTNIDEIAIVANNSYHEMIEKLVEKNKFSKVKRILNAGETRNYSTLSALDTYRNLYEDCNMIFHDAARPLLNIEIIDHCLEVLKTYNAVSVAVAATDTIVTIDRNTNIVKNIPDRNELMCSQTPQCFKLSTLDKAYKLALQDANFTTTDDCGVVKKYLPKEKIFIINGSYSNIKITHREDLVYANALFQLNTQKLLVPDEKLDLSNKVIVIFGSHSDIGQECTKLARQKGATVYPLSKGDNVDIANVESVRQALQNVHAKEKHIDAILITEDLLSTHPLVATSYEDIGSLIGNNYLGNIIVAKESFEYLCKSKGSLIFFTASYTMDRANCSVYNSTKAAVINLMQGLSQEWESYSIKVNCINSELIATSMPTKNFAIEDAKTLLTVQEIAQKTIQLLGDEFTYSGTIIDIGLIKS